MLLMFSSNAKTRIQMPVACCTFCAIAGAGANTRDSPASVTGYIPTEQDVGGLFDDAKRAKRIYASKSQSVQQQHQKQQHAPRHRPALPRGGSAAALAEAVAAASAEQQQQQQQSDTAANQRPIGES